MSRRTRFHSFKQYTCTVAGVLVGGHGDDGGVEIEFASDLIEDTVGADGEVTINTTNDDRAYVTFNMKQSSAGYARLMALLQAQKLQLDSTGRALPLPFESFNPLTGERVSGAELIFKTRPTISEQKSAQDREIGAVLPYAQYTPPITI
jgi:hypothetical protein